MEHRLQPVLPPARAPAHRQQPGTAIAVLPIMRWRVAAAVTAGVFALSCAQHANSSSSKPFPHVAHVVVLGDSVGHGAGDETRRGISGNLGAVNLALNGARTYDVRRVIRARAARIAIASADAVILSIGGNDLFGDPLSRTESTIWPSVMMSRTIARIDRIVSDIRGLNPS